MENNNQNRESNRLEKAYQERQAQFRVWKENFKFATTTIVLLIIGLFFLWIALPLIEILFKAAFLIIAGVIGLICFAVGLIFLLFIIWAMKR